MKRLQDQTIVVTGAGRGIGLAVARAVADEGAHVVLFEREADRLESALTELRGKGARCDGTALDVADADAFIAAIGAAAKAAGRLDGLVNNAAEFLHTTIADTSLEDWRRSFAVNVDAPFIGMKAAFEVMRRQGKGAVVNIASISGVRVRIGSSAYAASKAALIHLGAVAAIEAASSGIRVNAVLPGGTTTPAFMANFADTPPEELAAMGKAGVPLGRFGRAEDVAKAVVFLLSDEAEFITGETLRVEGGAYWTR